MLDFLFKTDPYKNLPILGPPIDQRRLQNTLRHLARERLKEVSEVIQLDYKILNLYLDHMDPSRRALFKRHKGVIKFQTEMGEQLVLPLGSDDFPLFHHKREMAQFTIHTEEKKYRRLELGDIGEYQLTQKDLHWIEECFKDKRREEIQSLEITHSHTVLDLLLFSPEGSQLLAGGLSHEDIKLARFLQKLYQVPVTISALLKSGLKYEYSI